jgi:lysophospholipid acyltransferase (LPLAT)-like uncharacterized protein
MAKRLLSWLAGVLLRLLGGTLRWTFVDEAGYMQRAGTEPWLVGVWHNRILVLPLCFEWFCKRRRRLNILTSASRDGALLSAFVSRFGMESVRGSTSRRGVVALRHLQKLLAEGSDVAITPDGPRGPVYEISPGLIYLASKTGLPVMTIRVEYQKFWELRSWDKFRIPKPFSAVEIRFQVPIKIEDGSPEMIEIERQRLASMLG